MPAFEKSPPELIDRFAAVAARFPDAQRKKMFGYPALFLGGRLVTGLFADRWMIRLADADRARLLAVPGAAPFEPAPGRVMKGYAVLPPDIVADDPAVDRWVGRALAYVQTLPAK
jgi:TfoX/Sxy family transcriptional regulator of competence genes